ncbi:hypothetical protein OGAPHI_006911 [Ogataea philodendri]|uniref:Uncharacterized protein n=1 Tax=Ogataea philodendri TaxID=1378263 RepID=A0A9P8NVL1_9ASCO|nr:uncharacterized protein OGAPHI_006911 [Ogataea philodendri]KAH3660325.1 hypothetical protein OGAPHI_006911 [Ogataea philodendri]
MNGVPLESVEFASIKQINPDLEGDHYLQLNVENTFEWINYVQNLVQSNTTDGIVVFVDCAYQFGTPEIKNSGFYAIKQKFTQSHGNSADVFDNVVIIHRDSLQDINHLLANIFEFIPPEHCHKSLNCIVVSNVSIFYWDLRDAENFDQLADFHTICKHQAAKLGCYVVSTRSLFD